MRVGIFGGLGLQPQDDSGISGYCSLQWIIAQRQDALDGEDIGLGRDESWNLPPEIEMIHAVVQSAANMAAFQRAMRKIGLVQASDAVLIGLEHGRLVTCQNSLRTGDRRIRLKNNVLTK